MESKYKFIENGEEVIVTRSEIEFLVCNSEMTEEQSDKAVLDYLSEINAQVYYDETFNNYQRATKITAKYPQESALEYLSLGIASEAGEVAGKMKKWIRDGDSKMTHEEWVQAMSSEIGDVLWYAARLADELDLSLAEIAEENMMKLLDRKARGVIGGSGDNR
jgi:NTP pyrophosphatase (non-canonical NTP hydrolase)